MEKWADYLISQVKHDSKGVITHVLLHTDNGSTASGGVVKTKDEVIQILKNGYSIKTILWLYPNWGQGAIVTHVNGEYLRTDRDKTVKDNLDNLIPLST